MTELILAGARSVFGLSELKSAFSLLGFNVSFIDAPFMADVLIHEFPETEKILFTTSIPENSVLVPLSEYWISRCIQGSLCRISEAALKACRSKLFLYQFMAEKGFSSPEIYSDIHSARKKLEEGQTVVVKPLGLHSGYGVEILDKTGINRLEKYAIQASELKNRTLRIMEIENKGVMFTEAVSGTEYSADCFFYKGKVVPVRICRKKIIIINDKPCTAVYELISEADCEYIKYAEILNKWVKALFTDDNISFAQFDFIDNHKGRIVPIDFATRVGGGISDLLIETKSNPYAVSIKRAFGMEILQEFPYLAQYNYLPRVTGYIKDDSYNILQGKKRVFKKKGDYVISNPSSVGSRAAIVITEMKKEFDIQKLILGEKYITPRGL